MQPKRLIISVLVVILMLGAAVMSVAAASKPFELSVKIDSETAVAKDPVVVQPGEEIQATVNIDSNPGVYYFVFYLNFDVFIHFSLLLRYYWQSFFLMYFNIGYYKRMLDGTIQHIIYYNVKSWTFFPRFYYLLKLPTRVGNRAFLFNDYTIFRTSNSSSSSQLSSQLSLILVLKCLARVMRINLPQTGAGRFTFINPRV